MLYGANALVFILYCMNTMCTQIIIIIIIIIIYTNTCYAEEYGRGEGERNICEGERKVWEGR